jgi:hypothetical protein
MNERFAQTPRAVVTNENFVRTPRAVTLIR